MRRAWWFASRSTLRVPLLSHYRGQATAHGTTHTAHGFFDIVQIIKYTIRLLNDLGSKCLALVVA